MQHKILEFIKSTFMHAEKIFVHSTHIFFLRGIWRALLSWRCLSQNIPSKIQRIIQENLSKSKLCVPVRKNQLHSPPKTRITGATLNFGCKKNLMGFACSVCTRAVFIVIGGGLEPVLCPCATRHKSNQAA